MTEISVRELSTDEWPLFMAIRLEALRESPEAFVATHDEESELEDSDWEARVARAPRLLAEVDGKPVGVVSLGEATAGDDPDMGELYGLWVRPEWRGKSVAAALVKRGAEFARRRGNDQLAYWVGSDNGRAVAFASSFGFRPTDERRPMRRREDAPGDEEDEIMLVLALGDDRGQRSTR